MFHLRPATQSRQVAVPTDDEMTRVCVTGPCRCCFGPLCSLTISSMDCIVTTYRFAHLTALIQVVPVASVFTARTGINASYSSLGIPSPQSGAHPQPGDPKMRCVPLPIASLRASIAGGSVLVCTSIRMYTHTHMHLYVYMSEYMSCSLSLCRIA